MGKGKPLTNTEARNETAERECEKIAYTIARLYMTISVSLSFIIVVIYSP